VPILGLREFDTGTGKLRELDIKAGLKKIESMGFIRTMRSGDTGIGFTLETLLGLRETNVRGRQDFTYDGKPVELKSQRKATTSMITLFTMEPHKIQFNDRKMIETYGYVNSYKRKGLKVTLTTRAFVPQGLKLRIDAGHAKLAIADRNGYEPWYWTMSDLKPKIERLLLVFADSKGTGKEEEFHYNEAYLLVELQTERFFSMFDEGVLVVDLRMHVRKNNTVRNHGTAFRIRGLEKLMDCYDGREKLL